MHAVVDEDEERFETVAAALAAGDWSVLGTVPVTATEVAYGTGTARAVRTVYHLSATCPGWDGAVMWRPFGGPGNIDPCLERLCRDAACQAAAEQVRLRRRQAQLLYQALVTARRFEAVAAGAAGVRCDDPTVVGRDLPDTLRGVASVRATLEQHPDACWRIAGRRLAAALDAARPALIEAARIEAAELLVLAQRHPDPARAGPWSQLNDTDAATVAAWLALDGPDLPLRRGRRGPLAAALWPMRRDSARVPFVVAACACMRHRPPLGSFDANAAGDPAATLLCLLLEQRGVASPDDAAQLLDVADATFRTATRSELTAATGR